MEPGTATSMAKQGKCDAVSLGTHHHSMAEAGDSCVASGGFIVPRGDGDMGGAGYAAVSLNLTF